VIYCLYVVLALIDLRRHGVSTGFFEIGSWFWGAFPARGCAFQYHMIIHYLPLIYHWSYMIIHGLPLKCPAGSLPFCKAHWSSLGISRFQLGKPHFTVIQLSGRGIGPWPQEDDEGEAQKMPMEVGLSSRLLARLLVGSQLQFMKRTGPRTFPWHHVPLWFKTCE
jgi:hypothetical protein